MIFPRKPETWRDNALNRIIMSKVHSVPRKQGRRLAGIDFVYFGVESLFAWELRACINRIILSIPKDN